MEDNLNHRPLLSHVEPVLAVSNVMETIAYWQDIIGFPDRWFYGDPPNHGGVSWQGGTFMQFAQNAELAQQCKGQSVWIRARNIHSLYELHQQRKANIVAPLESKPWGHHEYTLEDNNGYSIHFSAPYSSDLIGEKALAPEIKIMAKAPSLKDFNRLMDAVGWVPGEGREVKKQLTSTAFAVVAQHQPTKEIVGCALLMGDGVSFYYVKDVMVHPRWQHQRIGTAMMDAIMQWAEKNVPDKSTIGLFTGDQLAGFYKQFGLTQACGMFKQIHRK